MSDRTVHARITEPDAEPIEVVRYGRAGRWWREQGIHRQPLTFLDAVELAAAPLTVSGTHRVICWELPGGKRFDRQVKMTRALLDAGVTPEWMAR